MCVESLGEMKRLRLFELIIYIWGEKVNRLCIEDGGKNRSRKRVERLVMEMRISPSF